jgi:hypothetical protein
MPVDMTSSQIVVLNRDFMTVIPPSFRSCGTSFVLCGRA